METITIDDFTKVQIRVGRVVSCEPFPEGKYSTHILQIDFGGEMGEKKSLARLAPAYAGPELAGTQVLAVTNVPPRQIGTHFSEVLTLGVPDEQGNVSLIKPDRDVPLGGALH